MKHYVEVDGARVSYQVDGEGPALILLHGTGGNSETNWSELIEELSLARRVIRPDYSGSGDTTDDGRPLTVAMLASQVVAAADDAGATTFDLVGFSLGAAVAVYIAAEYSERVRSVVALSGFTHSADTRQILQFGLWRDLIRTDRSVMARLLLLTGFSPNFLARMDSQTIADAISAIVEKNNWDGMARQVELDMTIDIRLHAPRVTRPTLVIGCTHDQMVPPGHARSLADIVPGARFIEIATGHLSTLETPHDVGRIILEFINQDLG